MKVTFDSRKITVRLFSLMVLLVLAHVVCMVLKYHFGIHDRFKLFRLFDLGQEHNFPTYFSSLALFACSGLLYSIYRESRKIGCLFRKHWGLLSLIFLYLSIDEFVMLHERLARPMRRILGPSDLLHFAWVVPFGIFVIVLSIFYLKFILHLPERIRFLSVLSAVIYVSGALGVEIAGGYYHSVMGMANGPTDMVYSSFQMVEETMEMTGVILYIHALLLHIERGYERMELQVRRLSPGPAPLPMTGVLNRGLENPNVSPPPR